MSRPVSLIIRNVVFAIVVPGLGGAAAPWWILARQGGPSGSKDHPRPRQHLVGKAVSSQLATQRIGSANTCELLVG
jgi:hypothetical protein